MLDTSTAIAFIQCYGAFFIMPTYKYEFIVNGKVDYTCFDMGSVRFYSFNLDMAGIDYEVVKTCSV